jgi:hypothetical protein
VIFAAFSILLAWSVLNFIVRVRVCIVFLLIVRRENTEEGDPTAS